MPKVKSVKSGTKLPNTVEITPLLTFSKTFDEVMLKKEGFTIMEVVLKVDRKNSTGPKEYAEVGDLTISWYKEVRERYGVIKITHNFNRNLRALNIFDINTNWPIHSIKIMNNKSKNIILAKAVGHKTRKKMIVYDISGLSHTVCSLEDIMKEVADLFYCTCFYKTGCPSMLCDI
jgi:hypothetical protein